MLQKEKGKREMEKLFNESIEMLRNKQLETLKDVATEILNAPLEENHSLIIINGKEEGAETSVLFGGESKDLLKIVQSLLETTDRIVSGLPSELKKELFESNPIEVFGLLLMNRSVFQELSEFFTF